MHVKWNHAKILSHPESMSVSSRIFHVNDVDMIWWLLSIWLKQVQFICCFLCTPGLLGCPCEHHQLLWNNCILLVLKKSSSELWDVHGKGRYYKKLLVFNPSAGFQHNLICFSLILQWVELEKSDSLNLFNGLIYRDWYIQSSD